MERLGHSEEAGTLSDPEVYSAREGLEASCLSTAEIERLSSSLRRTLCISEIMLRKLHLGQMGNHDMESHRFLNLLLHKFPT